MRNLPPTRIVSPSTLDKQQVKQLYTVQIHNESSRISSAVRLKTDKSVELDDKLIVKKQQREQIRLNNEKNKPYRLTVNIINYIKFQTKNIHI